MSRDFIKGKYHHKRYFGREFEAARERLAPMGGKLEPGVHDYEAFTFTMPGLKLIFYPHRTSAGNAHIRVRSVQGSNKALIRQAIFLLAENSCTFQYPMDTALHREAVGAAVKRQREAMTQEWLKRKAEEQVKPKPEGEAPWGVA